MKIVAINNSPNFKGLWGEPQKTFAGNEHTSLSFITKTYYPFKNESKESIEETKKSNQSNYHADWYETGGTYVDEKVDVEVKKALNFTEQEFLAYKKSGLGAIKPEEISHPIEKELINRGLYNYMNKSQKYIDEVNWRTSYGYKILNFLKNIGQKLKKV